MRLHIGPARANRVLGVAILVAASIGGRAEAGRVTGTVLGRDGKPAAGAKVRVAKLAIQEPLDSREATADDSGKFGVEVGPGQWAVFALRGEEGGRAPWSDLAKVTESGPDPAPATVRLGAPSKLKGRLLDAETGEPIAGGRFAMDDARLLDVDAQGRFEVPGLEMTNHEAYPLCPGHERKRILFDTTGRPDAELVLKLPRAGKVVGRVLDPAGKPIPGAVVGLRTSGTIFSGSALWEKCSDDGRFSYDGKPLGRTGSLTAIAPGYQDTERADVVALDVANPSEVDFTLQPSPTRPPAGQKPAGPTNFRNVSGKVLGPDGKPVASAVVRWDLRVSSDKRTETRTDAAGAFRLEAVPDAPNVLSVMARGLAPSFPMVEAGGDREVTVELKAGATIKGRVVDDANQPIKDVWVIARIANPKPNWAGWIYLSDLQANTDGDGRFTLEGMPEGITCDAGAENWSIVRDRPLSASDESKNAITLVGPGAIRGRVVDPAGNPVKNFRVQVGIPKQSRPGDAVGGFFAGYSGTGLAFTRPDGEFTISGLTAGNFVSLTVVAENYGAGEVEKVLTRTITSLKPADDLTIKLGTPHSLRVRVYRAEGKVVEGARVTLIHDEGRGGFQWGFSESSWDDSVTGRVDERGWAEFPSNYFGKGTVVVRARGFSRKKLEWVNGEEEFNVFLEPEAKISGTVLDEAGHPIAGASILLANRQNEVVNVPIDDKDGRFQAEGLASGSYSMTVNSTLGPNLFSKSIDLAAGQSLTEEIRVKPPAPAAPKNR